MLVVGCLWLTVRGWLLVVSCLWLAVRGWLFVVGCLWLTACGWLSGCVWLAVCGWLFDVRGWRCVVYCLAVSEGHIGKYGMVGLRAIFENRTPKNCLSFVLFCFRAVLELF